MKYPRELADRTAEQLRIAVARNGDEVPKATLLAFSSVCIAIADNRQEDADRIIADFARRMARLDIEAFIRANPKCTSCSREGGLIQHLEGYWVKCSGCGHTFVPNHD